jgi:hypothetical protein
VLGGEDGNTTTTTGVEEIIAVINGGDLCHLPGHVLEEGFGKTSATWSE